MDGVSRSRRHSIGQATGEAQSTVLNVLSPENKGGPTIPPILSVFPASNRLIEHSLFSESDGDSEFDATTPIEFPTNDKLPNAARQNIRIRTDSWAKSETGSGSPGGSVIEHQTPSISSTSTAPALEFISGSSAKSFLVPPFSSYRQHSFHPQPTRTAPPVALASRRAISYSTTDSIPHVTRRRAATLTTPNEPADSSVALKRLLNSIDDDDPMLNQVINMTLEVTHEQARDEKKGDFGQIIGDKPISLPDRQRRLSIARSISVMSADPDTSTLRSKAHNSSFVERGLRNVPEPVEVVVNISPDTLARSEKCKEYLQKRYGLIGKCLAASSEFEIRPSPQKRSLAFLFPQKHVNRPQSTPHLTYNPLEIIRWRRTMWQRAVKSGQIDEIRKWKPRGFVWGIGNGEFYGWVNDKTQDQQKDHISSAGTSDNQQGLEEPDINIEQDSALSRIEGDGRSKLEETLSAVTVSSDLPSNNFPSPNLLQRGVAPNLSDEKPINALFEQFLSGGSEDRDVMKERVKRSKSRASKDSGLPVKAKDELGSPSPQYPAPISVVISEERTDDELDSRTPSTKWYSKRKGSRKGGLESGDWRELARDSKDEKDKKQREKRDTQDFGLEQLTPANLLGPYSGSELGGASMSEASSAPSSPTKTQFEYPVSIAEIPALEPTKQSALKAITKAVKKRTPRMGKGKKKNKEDGEFEFVQESISEEEMEVGELFNREKKKKKKIQRNNSVDYVSSLFPTVSGLARHHSTKSVGGGRQRSASEFSAIDPVPLSEVPRRRLGKFGRRASLGSLEDFRIIEGNEEPVEMTDAEKDLIEQVRITKAGFELSITRDDSLCDLYMQEIASAREVMERFQVAEVGDAISGAAEAWTDLRSMDLIKKVEENYRDVETEIRSLDSVRDVKDAQIQNLLGRIDCLADKLNQDYFQRLRTIEDTLTEIQQSQQRFSFLNQMQEIGYSLLAWMLQVFGTLFWFGFQFVKIGRRSIKLFVAKSAKPEVEDMMTPSEQSWKT